MNPTGRHLLRGYGPLFAALVAFVVMAALVPTVDERSHPSLVAVNGSTGGGPSSGGVGPGVTDTVPGGSPLTTGGTSATTGNQTKPQSGPATNGRVTGKTASCAGPQIPNDPYSPPCVLFSGGNGGMTSPGVTGDTITASWRVSNDPGFQQALANAAHANISDTPADIQRTAAALAQYFNTHFQLYGRKVKLNFYNGQGSQTNEILGQGQEQAEVDATHVASEMKAFVDLTANTPPYSDALFRRHVIAVGAPYMSAEWMTSRAPYVWSELTDCSIITQTVSDYALKKLLGRTATWAGGSLQGKPRKTAVIAPENTWYQECVAAGDRILAAGHQKADEHIKYQLDLATMSNQATEVIAKLKSEGVTTISCGCDPVFPVFLTQQAAQQDYYPEWIVLGTALTDADLVGQLYNQPEWSHAFGISFSGANQPQRASLGYNAYKTVRQDEPAVIVDLIYEQMYLFWLGVQLAGPNLTPQSFQTGMFSYPGGHGPYGTWGFGPGHFTPTQDAREIYWDPNAVSAYNNQQGAYIETEPGKRYRIGQWPTGPPNVFKQH